MAQGKYSQRRRRRRLNPRFVILVLIFITVLALLGTVLLRRCEKAPEVAPSTAATAATTAAKPATKPTTAPTTVPTTAPTTAPTTEPTTEAITEETTEVTTEETTEETTAETTEPVPTVPPTVPPAPESSAIGAQVAALAKEQVGKPYLYGGVGPDAFDISGLVVYCFARNGTEVPRTTDYQVNAGVAVPWDSIEPGDVVFFWSENPGAAEYEGIYIGDGKFVAARSQDKPVSEMDLWGDYFSSRFVCARRFY